jgi:hypothetical protein
MLCAGPDDSPICVPRSQVCADDGAQCADGQDEDPTVCCSDKHGFLCPSTQTCLEPQHTCDGTPDCSGGEDESIRTCGCGAGEFMCNDGSRCLAQIFVCDATTDCDDGSDEDGCGGGEVDGCPDGWFECEPGRCAPSADLCDPKP